MSRFAACSVRQGIRAGLRGAATTGLLLLLLAAPIAAEDHVPFAPRTGLDLAQAAARSWSPDAVLVYVENDEDLDAGGASPRWGYLFHSTSLEMSRAYSVRDGRILVAENLEMKFDAPPLVADWIDSGPALEEAEQSAGHEFRKELGGELRTMLLMRGAFHDEDPDRTTWTIVYTSPRAPSLFVVVDAIDGRVRRTWRG